jgi:hypothetical protein
MDGLGRDGFWGSPMYPVPSRRSDLRFGFSYRAGRGKLPETPGQVAMYVNGPVVVVVVGINIDIGIGAYASACCPHPRLSFSHCGT